MIGHPQFRPALCEDSPASWEIADGFTIYESISMHIPCQWVISHSKQFALPVTI
jgi:hypothetical protein